MSRSFGPIEGIAKQLWRTARPDLRRVKLLLFDSFGEVVLTRDSASAWVEFTLPSGEIGSGETPAQAAMRTARTALGYDIGAPVFVGEYRNETSERGEVIYLFRAVIDQPPLADKIRPSGARLFSVERLPSATAAATRRRIDEHLRRRIPDGEW